MSVDWKPSASIAALRRRAEIINQIRQFFAEREVLEVDTPSLSASAVSDPHLFPFSTDYVPEGAGTVQQLYLHTSPEYPMKRLLAAGSGAIWQLCKVYRNGETGSRHNPEFSMLEWYRPDFDHHRLMDEVDALLQQVLASPPARRVTYAAVFAEHTGLNIHRCSDQQLRTLAVERFGFSGELSRDGWLNLLFSHCVEPLLLEPTIVFAFPASQAALAQVVSGDDVVPSAARFELFIEGMELANGYFELTDAQEQERRFAADQQQRRGLGYAELPLDQPLLAALRSGLPECAGVALGVDRLIMLALGASRIDQVIAFDLARA